MTGRAAIVGIMGPGEGASPADLEAAFALGTLIGQQGWVLLTGGRNQGVMEEASRGARSEDGLTLGILPGTDHNQSSTSVLIPVLTGMGSARNNINVLSCDVVVAIGFAMGAGTASEVALAIKARKPLLLVTNDPTTRAFFERHPGVHHVTTSDEAEELLTTMVAAACPNAIDMSVCTKGRR